MPGDLAFLEKHPTGRYDDPALRFPFGPAELLEFECIYTVIADRWRYGDGDPGTTALRETSPRRGIFYETGFLKNVTPA